MTYFGALNSSTPENVQVFMSRHPHDVENGLSLY